MDYTKEELEQAVKEANGWVESGEGVGVMYYYRLYGRINQTPNRLMDIIQYVLEH